MLIGVCYKNLVTEISLLTPNQRIAVAYLARGADRNCLLSFERFMNSYIRNYAGVKHSLYVIFKGFANNTDLKNARALFNCIPHEAVFLDDGSLDIGAYIEWANMIEEDWICVFNTGSEILAPDWLRKLAVNLLIPNVGLVGATASYESLNELNRSFSFFPNIHIRTSAFMINRMLFLSITEGLEISHKIDAYHFESGPKSLTRQVLANKKKILLVGRNGRGYSPKFWATSDTFRQGAQKNLLVADSQTRNFSELPWTGKRASAVRTWGKYISRVKLLTI